MLSHYRTLECFFVIHQNKLLIGKVQSSNGHCIGHKDSTDTTLQRDKKKKLMEKTLLTAGVVAASYLSIADRHFSIWFRDECCRLPKTIIIATSNKAQATFLFNTYVRSNRFGVSQPKHFGDATHISALPVSNTRCNA